MSAKAHLIMARAQRRLTEHVASHGIDDRALWLMRYYEREYAGAVAHPLAPAPATDDDLTAVMDAIGGDAA